MPISRRKNTTLFGHDFVKRGNTGQRNIEDSKTSNEIIMKPGTNVKFTKKSAHLLCCSQSLQTELSTAFEKFEKPRNFEPKTLKEVEGAKIQLLRYISIFGFATLPTPADTFITKFYFRATAFMQQRPELNFMLGVVWCA